MDNETNKYLNMEAPAGVLPDSFSLPEYVQPIRPKTVFSKLEKGAAFITAALALLFVHFVLWNITGFFTTVFYMLLITAAVVILKKGGRRLNGFQTLWTAVLYLFSTVFSITANETVKFLDIVFLFAGIAYLVYLAGGESRAFGRFFPFELLKSSLADPFSHFGKEYSAISDTAKQTRAGRTVKPVILGIIIAVPLTSVVGSLLMSADSGVEQMLIRMADLIHPENIWTLIWELLISIPVGGYLFGMLYSSLHRSDENSLDEQQCEKLCESARKISNAAVYTAVTPICVLYGLFFISQANYFLSAFAGRLPDHYSYAQYARKGFFELFAIELINAAVIFCMSFFSKKCGKNKPKALKFYTVLISVFTLVITATAISKMVMYIENYGLTQLRVYTTWFMVLTAVMFIYVIIRQFKPDFGFMRAAACTFTVMFALLCFSRPDALIAKFNLENRAEKLSAYDIVEMSGLSDDAAAVILDKKYHDVIQAALRSEANHTGINSAYQLKCRISSTLDNSPYAELNLSAVLIRQRAGR